jgi:RNA polymerase sigma-70 factor (ECF subfamily)
LEINKLQELARNGDLEAENELFRRLSARFGLFIRQRISDRAQAEEVVQDALTTVFEKYRGIEFESSFSAWAYQVLRNKMMTYGTTVGRRQNKLEELRSQGEAISNSDAPSRLEQRLLECLHALNRSNTRHARILNLHYQGYGVAEICQRLNLTRTNFYTILSRARRMLLACLEKGEGS